MNALKDAVRAQCEREFSDTYKMDWSEAAPHFSMPPSVRANDESAGRLMTELQQLVARMKEFRSNASVRAHEQVLEQPRSRHLCRWLDENEALLDTFPVWREEALKQGTPAPREVIVRRALDRGPQPFGVNPLRSKTPKPRLGARQLAVISILAGNFPAGPETELGDGVTTSSIGLSVNWVLDRESKSVREAMKARASSATKSAEERERLAAEIDEMWA